jgi:hypothetical protein
MEDPNVLMASKKVEAKRASAAPRIQYTPQDSTPGKALNPHRMKVAIKEAEVAKPPEEISDSNVGDFMPVEAKPSRTISARRVRMFQTESRPPDTSRSRDGDRAKQQTPERWPT